MKKINFFLFLFVLLLIPKISFGAMVLDNSILDTTTNQPTWTISNSGIAGAYIYPISSLGSFTCDYPRTTHCAVGQAFSAGATLMSPYTTPNDTTTPLPNGNYTLIVSYDNSCTDGMDIATCKSTIGNGKYTDFTISSGGGGTGDIFPVDNGTTTYYTTLMSQQTDLMIQLLIEAIFVIMGLVAGYLIIKRITKK